MNKLYCLIGMFITCGVCDAQNLVPNGDFEQYIYCPFQLGQLDSALFWINPTDGTTDYFNQCATLTPAGVPDNSVGFQQARSGVGYGGLILYEYWTSNYREYMETPLTFPLVNGSCYHFEMYINLGNSMRYTSDDIQIYFSDTIFSGINNQLVLQYTPQIINSAGNYPDTLNWILVHGDYIASGGEAYLIIGNFKNDSNTDTVNVNNSSNAKEAYVYIDDVSLTLCSTGINESNEISNEIFYPNPFNDKLNITVKRNGLVEVNLFDITSRKILNLSFTKSTSINTDQLGKGIYLYEVRSRNGVVKKGKVVKD